MENSYIKLQKKFERIYRLRHLDSVATWDEAVHMPPGGGEARALAIAEGRVIQQEMLTAPETLELIEKAKALQLNELDRSNVREMERECRLASAVSADLLTATSLANSKCEQAWRTMRAQNNWKDFLPLLEEVVRLNRQVAEQKAATLKLSVYDALMESFSIGISTKTVERLFGELRTFLPEFIGQAIEKQKSFRKPKGKFPIEAQKQLGLKLMEVLGFNFDNGRLDVSHHPFCGGVSEDTRITTRYNEADFTSSLMGVIHETGHAMYGQNPIPDYITQPVGRDPGMAIHESQSLFCEMQIARSREFLSFNQPQIVAHLGEHDHPEFFELENLVRLFTEVERGYIRVDADEVTYPAHVILRFEIEKDLIEGKLAAKDLPEVWDQKMQSYLGLSTAGNYKDGCMQDMHWPSGAFGYFPSYTLGALIAAQLFASLEKARPKVREEISRGDFSGIRGWLREHIWHKGSLHDTEGLVKAATGAPLDVKFFKSHLEKRYLS